MQGKKKHDAVFIDGDIFNSKDFADFIEKIKSDDNKPALVTFNPMA